MHAAEAVRDVEHQAVLVDVELDRGCAGGDDRPATVGQPHVPVDDSCTSSVSTSTVTTGSSAVSPTCSGSRRIGRSRVNGVHVEVDVVAAVELDAVRTVHLAPPRGAVGGQPQVGLVEVAEQQELAHLPGRRRCGSTYCTRSRPTSR